MRAAVDHNLDAIKPALKAHGATERQQERKCISKTERSFGPSARNRDAEETLINISARLVDLQSTLELVSRLDFYLF